MTDDNNMFDIISADAHIPLFVRKQYVYATGGRNKNLQRNFYLNWLLQVILRRMQIHDSGARWYAHTRQ